MNNWYKVRGTGTALGSRYYGPPLFSHGNTFGAAAACSGDQVYLVPWYTGPGLAIDQLMTCIDGGSVSAHLGIYSATHVRHMTPDALFVQTSVALTSTLTTASINFTAPVNAVLWLGIQLAEARNMRTLLLTSAYATLGWEVDSVERAYVGLVCSYAYASGMPTTLAGVTPTRIGPTDPPPYIGVRYA